MSAGHEHTHHGHVIPLCRVCRREATQVVAYADGEPEDALPFCPMCANDAIENAPDAREYPIEEYYTPASNRVCQFDPHDSPEFELYDPDNSDDVWVVAYNSVDAGSSKDLSEWC